MEVEVEQLNALGVALRLHPGESVTPITSAISQRCMEGRFALFRSATEK